MSEEKNTVTENKMEDKNMTLSETAKQDTEESIKKEAEKNEIMTSPEKAEETVKDESEKEEPKEKDELLLSEESEKITNEESTPQNFPVKIKPEDLFVKPILSSDSDEEFMEKFKYGIQVGFKKMKCAFEGCVIIGALFNQLDERRELLKKNACEDIYEYGKKYYGMSHTVVFDYMQIAKKFGKIDPETHVYGLKDEVKNCTYSALKELYSVDEKDLKHFIGRDLTVKEIRKLKRDIKKRNEELENKSGSDSKQGNSQPEKPCEQENAIYSEEKATENVDSDRAGTKDSEVEAKYEDLSEKRLYWKKIKVTQKITYDTKALRKCLEEFNEKNPKYKGNIEIVFYKCEISEEA